jgi:hypothetical protein
MGDSGGTPELRAGETPASRDPATEWPRAERTNQKARQAWVADATDALLEV